MNRVTVYDTNSHPWIYTATEVTAKTDTGVLVISHPEHGTLTVFAPGKWSHFEQHTQPWSDGA